MLDGPESQTAHPQRQSLRLFIVRGCHVWTRHRSGVGAPPCSPEIYEFYMRSAEDYVLLAEQANGHIPRRNGPAYVWGVAPDAFERMQPDARVSTTSRRL